MADTWDDLAGQWRLVEMDGTPVTASATLDIEPGGVVRGQAPCNGFGFRQSADFPAFQAGPIRATKRACPDLPVESAFLSRLQTVDTAEMDDSRLILRTPDGGALVFEQAPAPH